MVIKVNGLVAALEAHQSVGLEGWWSKLIDGLNKVTDVDEYKGNKVPFSREYSKLIHDTFENQRWVKQLTLIDGTVSSGGIANRLYAVPGKDYWEKVQTAIKNAQWLGGYADFLFDYSKSVEEITRKLMKDWKKGSGGLNRALWEKAIEELQALQQPLEYASKHAKPGLEGELVKVRSTAGWGLSKKEGAWPKSLPAMTKEQLDFAIKFIVDVSNGDHDLSTDYYRVHQATTFSTAHDDEDIVDEMFELDDALFSKYHNLTDGEAICGRILKVPGFGDHYEIAAALVIWAVRSTGSTGASLESFNVHGVGLENWWDEIVDAIVPVEDLDKYDGDKSPWSKEYKQLVSKTFGNARWLSKQQLVTEPVTAAGVASRLRYVPGDDCWEKIKQLLDNVTWLRKYIPIVKQYSDDIEKIHNALVKELKDGIDKAKVKQAIKAIEALDVPFTALIKMAKFTVHGKPTSIGKYAQVDFEKPKVTLPKTIPALTETQFKEAVKLIVDLSSGKHPLAALEEEYANAARFLDCKDGDDFWDELQDFDEDLYLAYTDVTYWQSLWDQTYPPGFDADTIVAALVVWCGRSVGKTAASLENFNTPTVTLELIARTAHEAVRSLAQSYGDNSHQSWEDSPEWVRVSGMNGAALHVLNPELTAEQTHEAWLKAKQEEGWSCGPTKDADRKEHPCMVPYAELSREHRLKDYLFKSIVDAFMACLREDNPEVQVVGLECACSGLEQRYEGSLDGRY